MAASRNAQATARPFALNKLSFILSPPKCLLYERPSDLLTVSRAAPAFHTLWLVS